MLVPNLRRCLRLIRDVNTLPSHILANGDTAENTAHMYVLKGNKKRNMQKRKRDQFDDKFRSNQVPVEPNDKKIKSDEFVSTSSTESITKTKREKNFKHKKRKRRRNDP